MITAQNPSSWKDLQEEVAKTLHECGFSVEIEKTLTTARGTVELDVLANEEVDGRKYSIICECKYWRTNIPQNVIHGFRTVLSDLGYNVGYIITTSDFQSGAITAASYTNVELLNWEQFQARFFNSWYENHFVPTLTNSLDPLFTYSEPLLPVWFDNMSEEDKHTFIDLKDKYDIFGITMMSFSSYTRMFKKDQIPTLPLRARLKMTAGTEGKIPDKLMDEQNYREFLNEAIRIGQKAITEFRIFRDKYNDKKWQE